MKWNKFRLKTTTEAEDIVSSMLMDLGVQGIEIEDKIPMTQAEKEQMFVDILPETGINDGIAYISFYLEEDEDTRVLETRRFRFYCGCTLDRILPTLKTLQDNKEDLFQGEEELEVTCPRCAAIYRVTKENLED